MLGRWFLVEGQCNCPLCSNSLGSPEFNNNVLPNVNIGIGLQWRHGLQSAKGGKWVWSLITASSREKLSIFNLNFKSCLIKKQSRESSENEIALSRKCLGPIKYPKIFIDFLAELNYSKKRIFGKISVCPINLLRRVLPTTKNHLFGAVELRNRIQQQQH